jgi:hypothetical protein
MLIFNLGGAADQPVWWLVPKWLLDLGDVSSLWFDLADALSLRFDLADTSSLRFDIVVVLSLWFNLGDVSFAVQHCHGVVSAL